MSDDKNLHKNHRQRIMNRYRENGFSSFDEHNILEVLLFQSIPRADTNPTAHRLINEFGSLYDVLTASPDDLTKVQGVGPASANMLHLVFQTVQEASLRKMAEVPFTEPELYIHYAIEWFAGKPASTVAAMFFNDEMYLQHVVLLAERHMIVPQSYFEAIMRETAKHPTSKIILMHNHADGCMASSSDDRILTHHLYHKLAAEHIDLIEHLVVHEFNCIRLLQESVFPKPQYLP